MTTFIPLNKAEHATQTWRRPANYAFAATEALAPIVSAEAGIAAVNMPLAFTKSGNLVQLVAVMAPKPGKNNFVSKDGQWLGLYVPAVFRAFPFRLGRIEGRNDFAVCIAKEGGYLGTGGEPLYDASGELAPKTKEAVDFLHNFEKSRQHTLFAGGALEEAGVLSPWPIKLREKDGREATSDGLLRVDEKALAQISDEAFLKLRKVGALAIAYAQLLSMSRLGLLGRLAQLAAAQPASPKKELNLDFLREDDGNLVF
jgi:hypothetical protein